MRYQSILASLVFLCILSCIREVYPVDSTGLTYRLNDTTVNRFNDLRVYAHFIKDTTFSYRYFFSNGTYCHFVATSDVTCFISETERQIPYSWGRYIIENDTLKIQYIGSHREPFEKFRAEKEWGVFFNDTTLFMLGKTIDNEIRSLNITYYLKKCDTIPTSNSILDKY